MKRVSPDVLRALEQNARQAGDLSLAADCRTCLDWLASRATTVTGREFDAALARINAALSDAAAQATVTVYISDDCLSLGPDATPDDLLGYSRNLAAHLGTHFGVTVEVRPVPGAGTRGPCPGDDAIAQYVRDLQAGDGWIDLLPR